MRPQAFPSTKVQDETLWDRKDGMLPFPPACEAWSTYRPATEPLLDCTKFHSLPSAEHYGSPYAPAAWVYELWMPLRDPEWRSPRPEGRGPRLECGMRGLILSHIRRALLILRRQVA